MFLGLIMSHLLNGRLVKQRDLYQGLIKDRNSASKSPFPVSLLVHDLVLAWVLLISRESPELTCDTNTFSEDMAQLDDKVQVAFSKRDLTELAAGSDELLGKWPRERD